jgi:hypothetical protein
MTYLIGFSGPPRSGKDTFGKALAALIEDLHGVQPQLLACSTPMREVVYALLGHPYDVVHYERCKDEPQDILGGTSIRQAMIALSEKHIKPAYGQDFWGRSLIERLWDPAPQVVIVTDMGFPSEMLAFERRFGAENCVWPQIEREGHDFSGDSRSYVGSPDRVIRVGNNEPGHAAISRRCQVLLGILEDRYGWTFPAPDQLRLLG